MSSRREPRVIYFENVQVYAPSCDYCGSDKHTAWDSLAPLKRLLAHDAPYFGGEAVCGYCLKITRVHREDAYAAREPERLTARLAELKAGAA